MVSAACRKLSSLANRARPTIGGAHVGLLRAIGRSPALRRKIIASTRMYDAGESYHAGYTIDAVVGHGMVGVAYRAHRTSGELVLVKIARAGFPLFERILEAEACAVDLVSPALTVARIVERLPHALVKEPIEGPTLQRILFSDALTAAQHDGLMAVLHAARALRDAHGFYLDPSPKNLAWEGGVWVVLDPGQPLLRPRNDAVLDAPSLATYRAHFTVTTARSEPSALADSQPEELPEASRYAFLREWEVWIPDLEDEREVLANIDDELRADEIVAYVSRREGTWVFEACASDAKLLERAEHAWAEDRKTTLARSERIH